MFSEKIGREKLLTILFAAAIILFCLPFVYTISYSLPCLDDFSRGSNCVPSAILQRSFMTAGSAYLNWKGEWIYYFLEVLLNPMIWVHGSMPVFGIFMDASFIIFVISLVCLTCAFLKRSCNVGSHAAYAGIALLLVYVCCNVEIYKNVFTWYVGSIQYLWAVFLACFTLALLIRTYDGLRRGNLTAVSVLGFFTSMSLAIVGPLCFSVLCMWFFGERKKNDRLIRLVPVLACIAGGLTAVLAPGNFNRHSEIDGTGLHIFSAFGYTLYDLVYYGGKLIADPQFFFGAIAVLFIAFIISKRNGLRHFINPFVPFIIAAVNAFLATYPAALGFSSKELPNRLIFSFNTICIISSLFACFNLGLYLAEKIKKEFTLNEYAIIILAVLIGFYSSAVSTTFLRGTPFFKQIMQAGDTKKYGESWRKIMDQVETSGDRDAVISVDEETFNYLLEDNDFLNSPYITSDASEHSNELVAAYYNKNSVRLVMNK